MRKIVVFASLLAGPAVATLEPALLAENPAFNQDPRAVRVKNFFEKNGCPLSKLASQFVREADANALDWRLLPSITFIESSGALRPFAQVSTWSPRPLEIQRFTAIKLPTPFCGRTTRPRIMRIVSNPSCNRW